MIITRFFKFPLLLVPVIFFGCKQFDNFNTIIKGEIPVDCIECIFTVNNTGSDADKEEGILDGSWITTGGYDFTYDPSGDNSFEIEIDWRFDANVIDPKKEVEFKFLTYKDSEQYNGFIDEDQTIQSIKSKIKAGRVYNWDTANNKLNDSGDKTDKRVGDDGKKSDTSAGSSSDACGDYKGPEFNIQIDSQCKTAQLYKCAGNADGVTVACALYKQWQDQDSSIPDCPYCK